MNPGCVTQYICKFFKKPDNLFHSYITKHTVRSPVCMRWKQMCFLFFGKNKKTCQVIVMKAFLEIKTNYRTMTGNWNFLTNWN